MSFHGESKLSHKKQKAVETSGNTQTLQVVTGVPPTSTGGGSTPVALAQTPLPPTVVVSIADPSRRSISSDTSVEESSPAIL
ncbi:UNVERIFIED_CONTAM: hypothetical protein Sradi_5754500 [Sesamum radiatum]|uniref:Uncharacterized protein n=1 Tax=Sesamum radiatum TaxID=300843 RepID=A0AAW2L561_SESRA